MPPGVLAPLIATNTFRPKKKGSPQSKKKGAEFEEEPPRLPNAKLLVFANKVSAFAMLNLTVPLARDISCREIRRARRTIESRRITPAVR